MTIPFTSLPDDLAAYMDECLLATIAGMNEFEFSNVCYGLSFMQRPWSALSLPMRACLQNGMLVHFPGMSPQSTLMTITSMERLAVQWKRLLPPVREEALKAIAAGIAKDKRPWKSVEDSLSAFATMGAKWKTLDEELRACYWEHFGTFKNINVVVWTHFISK